MNDSVELYGPHPMLVVMERVERLSRENAALRDVAEKFRAWTETKPHTVEESDALHEACEALGGYDAAVDCRRRSVRQSNRAAWTPDRSMVAQERFDTDDAKRMQSLRDKPLIEAKADAHECKLPAWCACGDEVRKCGNCEAGMPEAKAAELTEEDLVVIGNTALPRVVGDVAAKRSARRLIAALDGAGFTIKRKAKL